MEQQEFAEPDNDDFLGFFVLFVIIPCIYLVYGIVQGYKNSDGFLKLVEWNLKRF